jgi:hypothetical protein
MAVLLLLAAIGTVAMLGIAAARRRPGLRAVAQHEGARWIAMCRVSKGGSFFDRGRNRGGMMGPRGVLIYRDDALEWRPDRYEVRHGDQTFAWTADEVMCLALRRRLDISGIRYWQAKLRLPQGNVTLGFFKEVGDRPALLEGTLPRRR